MIITPALLVFALWPLLGTSPGGHVVSRDARWVFSSEHYKKGAIHPEEGGQPLSVDQPEWIGEGEHQSMLLPDKPMTYKVDSRELPSKKLSIEAWIAPKSKREFASIVCAAEDNSNDEAGFYLSVLHHRFAFFLKSEATVDRSSDDKDYLYADLIKFGEWHHIVATYDGKKKSLYVNGVLAGEAQEEQGDIHYKDGHDLAIGAFIDKDEKHVLDGAIHEVAIYGHVLSANIVKHRHKALAGKLPPLPWTKAVEPPKPKEPTPEEARPDAFKRGVDQALFIGVEHLLLNQHRDGSWSYRWSSAHRNGATSLAIYTLLKCGLQSDHPAIQKGLEFLRQKDPGETYSAGVQLLALGATGDKDNKKWAQRVLDKLLEWESVEQPGCWGYPGQPCLSNTHFAALGLWGAHDLGAKPKRGANDLWGRLLENLVKHQLSGADKLAKDKPQGFIYKSGDSRGETTTMTVAGLTMIGLAKEIRGSSIAGPIKKTRRVESQAFAYIKKEHNSMLLKSSPGGWGGEDLYYYYFGLEHIGAFFDLKKIGLPDWYQDGAKDLVFKRQESIGITGVPSGRGPWGSDIATCFALLFLRKASNEKPFGDAVTREVREQIDFQEDQGDVHLHVRRLGEKSATLTIGGFSEEFMSYYEDPLDPSRYGLRINSVEYWVNDVLAERVEGDLLEAWVDETYEVDYEFRSPGYHFVQVRVEVLPPNVDPKSPPDELYKFKSNELRVVSCAPTEAWMDGNLDEPEEDLLTTTTVTATASSGPADLACDGFQPRRWVCVPDDKDPWIRFDLEEPVKARRIRFSPANSSFAMRDYYGDIQTLAYRINDGKRVEHALNEGDLAPSVVRLKKRTTIESIEILVLDKTASKNGNRSVGFSAIEFLD